MNATDPIVLSVDLDDTTMGYLDGFAHFLREVKGMDIPQQVELENFDMESSGIIPPGSFARLHGEAVQAGLFRDLEPLPGAVEVLRSLPRRGYQVNIVTSRFINPGQHGVVVNQTAESLDRAGIPYDNILFLKEKWRFVADTYLDDAPHNIIPLRDLGRHVIVRDWGYNRDIPGVEHADTWEQIDTLLRARHGR